MSAAHLLLLALLQASDPVPDVDPIDAKFVACVDADSTTVGMANCADDAYVAWDSAMNSAYDALMKRLSKEEQGRLRESQRKWLSFRDAELVVIDDTYGHVEGTLYIPMRRNDRTSLVRDRALQLRSRLAVFEVESQ